MRTDVINAIESYDDPNSCSRSNDEELYTVIDKNGTKLYHMSKWDVVRHVNDEILDMAEKIATSEDNEAFEKVAKPYLEQFSAIEKEN